MSGVAYRRVCKCCLASYRRKHRAARKPWPEWVYHFSAITLCPRHAADHSEQSVRQHAKRSLRCVEWADRDAVRAVYAEAAKRRAVGENVHVDHIVPLLGKNVSGLHVASNLQIIPAHLNIKKGNSYRV
jgi:hypothetical protein